MNRLACIAACILVTTSGASADERERHVRSFQQGSDTFAAGDTARVSEPVKGDLVAGMGALLPQLKGAPLAARS
jgi:hypothetical protein